MVSPLLSIIPARGGSRGIPRKNMRLVGGQPLVAHMLTAVDGAAVSDRLIVSSDDAELLRWAGARGFETLERPAHLAGDEATISEVAAHVADELDWAGDVGVFQVTSPLIESTSIRSAVERFRVSDADSLASCVREPHLCWHDEHDDLARARPLFAARVNRQYGRPRVLRETGSIQLVRGARLRSARQMVTDRHQLFELPVEEALDIDTYDDLALARRRIEQGTIVFRLRANSRVGSGHLFHCLQLADELHDHRLRFLLHDCDPFVGDLLAERGHQSRPETDLRRDLEELAGSVANLVVNDILDTTEQDVLVERSLGFKVVNIEDLGPGARFADWVVNALYPPQLNEGPRVAWGPRFATLRDEFLHLPAKVVRRDPERVLITFGGTDPAGLAARCASLLAGASAEVRVIIGPGSSGHGIPDGVTVLHQVRSMAAEMAEADLILTSAGRTVYEAAATGTPVVVLAQNAREATHAHIGYDRGVVFLGIGPLVDDDHVANVVLRLLGDHDLRVELSHRLQRSIDFAGASRIGHRIRGLMRGLEP